MPNHPMEGSDFGLSMWLLMDARGEGTSCAAATAVKLSLFAG